MGSGVILKVGVEPEKNTTIVPKAIGQSLLSAKSRLWEQGLNIGNVHFDEGINLLNQKNAKVYRQSLGHNAVAELGSAVDLWLTLDETVVDKSSKASDKVAHELEEQRLEAEAMKRDSIEKAEAASRVEVQEVLQQSKKASETVTETENYTQVTKNLSDLKPNAVEVINNSGQELPHTGGMGTTLLYVGGSILVLLAVILLVTKRRMNAND